ncbi:UDP-glucose dehydrogenase family protein [Flavobacterium sp.]|jgi:UDPglucose 6-dehydrogenase|uniref:UDP-glucose dehydrogenase family protein n=1 Tax=Flavobacterium sp. TaxID=239 RepID=UPI0037C0B484
MSVKITMIGTGYVGLVTGACFAEIGHQVICVDKDIAKIEKLHQGIMPIYEPGLDELVMRNVKNGRLKFSTDVEASAKGRDAIFLCVGTPPHPETGAADLKYVYAAAVEVARGLDGFAVIVTKSTVPVGTNRQIFEIASKYAKSKDYVAVASNPEFLREGAAITDFLEPDRVVVGAENQSAAKLMRAIYEPIVSEDVPFVETAIESAEVIKYAANGFLAVKLSFINEVSDLCEAVGANVSDVARGIGLDKRIGSPFLHVGPGWGGSCFPKDSMALHRTAKDYGVTMRLIESAIVANDERKLSMADRIKKHCDDSLQGKRIAVLGLTFKGQTDDMRESPSLVIIPQLQREGATICAFDPSHPEGVDGMLPGVTVCKTPDELCVNADALVVMTEWREFRSYDYQSFAKSMNKKIAIDLRNLLDEKTMITAGFESYHRLGE